MIGGIVQGIGQIAGSLMNAKQEEKNRQMQIQENQKDRDWQEMMWNKSNEYNDPSQQLQRYKEAGLNPNLVFGQGGSSIAAQFGSPSSHNIGTSPQYGDALKGLGNVFTAIEELKNLKKTGENLDADTDKKEAEADEVRSRIPGNNADAEAKKIDNLFRMDKNQLDVEGKRLDNELKKETVGLTKEQREQIRVACDKGRKDIEYVDKMIQKADKDMEFTDKQMSEIDQRLAMAWAELGPRIQALNAQARRDLATAAAQDALANLYTAQAWTEDSMRGANLDKVLQECANLAEQGKAVTLGNIKLSKDIGWYDATMAAQLVLSYSKSFNNVATGISSFIPGTRGGTPK